MIYVTHDQVEAMTLADRIVVLDGGHIAQVGSPRELYQNPANLFVAQFIGSPKMNVMPCGTDGANFTLEGGRGGAHGTSGTPTQLGIRPEHIGLVATGAGHVDGTVDVVEYLGADTFLIVDCGALGQITMRLTGDTPHNPGEKIGLQFAPEHLHFFGADGLAL